tara:strand:- start:54 stop:635 length:582 start_codon:yes stop_codon:yes gene_type:complete
MHIKTLILFSFLSFNSLFASEKVFSVREFANMFIQPSETSPIIYPIEMGKEFVLKGEDEEWLNVLDEKTGLVGWIKKDQLSSKKPKGILKGRDYDQSFEIFKRRVLEMSASIKDAISVDTFLDVKHLGGAAAVVIADDEWFKGKRHANQAFQVYDLWKNQNQSPSFLSFRNESNKEQFIILSGPHRPRYLKSN